MAEENRFRAVTFTRSPQLVLDPREWFASWHGSGPDLVFDPGAVGPKRVPAVVRPTTELTVTAEPVTPTDPRWPFAGTVELVLARTPTGLLAFFGRVRSPVGPLLRLPLRATTCRLRVDGPGYAPVVLDPVVVPGPDDPPQPPIRFDLLPDPSYPFPTGPQPNGNPGPTLLVGDVLRPDGTGIPGTTVTATKAGGALDLVPTVTNDRGGWALVLDQKTDRTTVATPVDLTFAVPGAAPVTVAGVDFEAGRTTRFPRTSLRGAVRLADGRGVAGVAISLLEYPIDPALRPRSRPDGSWVYCFGVDRPAPTDPLIVTVQLEPPGGPLRTGPSVGIVVGQPTQVTTIRV